MLWQACVVRNHNSDLSRSPTRAGECFSRLRRKEQRIPILSVLPVKFIAQLNRESILLI